MRSHLVLRTSPSESITHKGFIRPTYVTPQSLRFKRIIQHNANSQHFAKKGRINIFRCMKLNKLQILLQSNSFIFRSNYRWNKYCVIYQYIHHLGEPVLILADVILHYEA